MTNPNPGMPDFSDGERFLQQVRGTLRTRALRNRIIATASTLAMATVIFLSGFKAVQEQNYRDIWESYLISEMIYEEASPDAEADAALYLNMILEEDFDQLLIGIYELGLQEELIFAYK